MTKESEPKPQAEHQQKPEGVSAPKAKDADSAKPVQANSNWSLGLVIIVIGFLLLARNLGFDWDFLYFHNWWAVFILLAAIPPLQSAFSQFQRSGWSGGVASSLISAGAIILLSLLFLLNLSLWTWWPVFIIVAGLMVISGRREG